MTRNENFFPGSAVCPCGIDQRDGSCLDPDHELSDEEVLDILEELT